MHHSEDNFPLITINLMDLWQYCIFFFITCDDWYTLRTNRLFKSDWRHCSTPYYITLNNDICSTIKSVICRCINVFTILTINLVVGQTAERKWTDLPSALDHGKFESEKIARLYRVSSLLCSVQLATKAQFRRQNRKQKYVRL